MPKVPSMDESAEKRRSKQKTQGVRQSSPVLDEGTPRKRTCWPFKWTLEDNRWYVNKARRAKQNPYSECDDALF